jgi:hypothetical protein
MLARRHCRRSQKKIKYQLWYAVVSLRELAAVHHKYRTGYVRRFILNEIGGFGKRPTGKSVERMHLREQGLAAKSARRRPSFTSTIEPA